MMDIDHMLNGEASRQHQQDLIREAQLDKLACAVRDAQRNDKAVVSLRGIFTAINHLILR